MVERSSREREVVGSIPDPRHTNAIIKWYHMGFSSCSACKDRLATLFFSNIDQNIEQDSICNERSIEIIIFKDYLLRT